MSQHRMNRGTSHIFYKTRMCQKFLEGNCPNDDNCCTFAHGSTDLREPPPNWQDLVNDKREQNWNEDQRIIHQMKLCKKFVNNGKCPYGDKCNFLHQSPSKFKAQIERARESSVIQIQTMVDPGQTNNGGRVITVTSASSDPNAKFLKTRICTNWETGKCAFGDKCHFAHGPQELQKPIAPTEGDASIAASSSLRLPVTELPPPGDSAMAVPLPKQGEGKGFAKLRLSQKKIKGIYGDWIDEEEDEQDY